MDNRVESIGVSYPIMGGSGDYVKRLGGWCGTRRKEKSEEKRRKKGKKDKQKKRAR